MATINDWVEGARPRTLPAALAPVFLGIGAAAHMGALSIPRSLLALTVALALQIGVNYSNDYSDGVRGSDTNRVGPPRLTGGGLAKPKVVLGAALACFALAGAAGLALVILSGQWWLILLGVLSIIAAWFYTGGRKPYGYSGYGTSELLVFAFFGLFATVGTTYVQVSSVPAWLWLAAAGIGLASVCLLMVNNIRDIDEDAKVGKNTLAVRLGQDRSRLSVLILLFWSASFGGIAAWGSGVSGIWSILIILLLTLAGATVSVPVLSGAKGKRLIVSLRNAGLYALAYGIVLGTVFAVGAPGGL